MCTSVLVWSNIYPSLQDVIFVEVGNGWCFLTPILLPCSMDQTGLLEAPLKELAISKHVLSKKASFFQTGKRDQNVHWNSRILF